MVTPESNIELHSKISVGDGNICKLHAMIWNPRPSDCSNLEAKAMIACVGEQELRIYRLKKDNKWESMPLKRRPQRECLDVHWHPKDGRLLACLGLGYLFLLSYRSHFSGFATQHYFKIPEGVNGASFAWSSLGKFLFMSVQPSPKIFFFTLSDGTPKDRKILRSGHVRYPCSTDKTPVVILSHPKEEVFFTCASGSKEILVWAPWPKHWCSVEGGV